MNRGDMNLEIRGFVDDDPAKQGTVIQGVKVIGTTRDLPRLVPELDIDHVVITIAQASRTQIRRIVEICESVPVKAQIIPGLYEILSGAVEISRIRDVEIEDLLGREPVRLDEEELRRFLAGKTVMVTGAGGSIGSELARQVARFGVGTLLLVERAEFALFDIDRELRAAWPELAIVPLVADVCDRELMRGLMERYRPSVVVHAAAHKHVPMMESNPTEAVKNNILATRQLGEVAGEAGVEAFIQISTDKAVRPTSVMGASKRVAELVVQDLNPTLPDALRVGALRQRAGVGGLGDPDLPGADPAGRAGDGHPPGHGALLHDHPGGRAAGAAGRRDGAGRRDLRPRHGRAGSDLRHGQGHDHALRAEAVRRHRHRVHRHAAGREALRGARTPRTRTSPRPDTRRSSSAPSIPTTTGW